MNAALQECFQLVDAWLNYQTVHSAEGGQASSTYDHGSSRKWDQHQPLLAMAKPSCIIWHLDSLFTTHVIASH